MLGLEGRGPPLVPRSGIQRGTPKRKAEHEPYCCRVAAATGRRAAFPCASALHRVGTGGKPLAAWGAGALGAAPHERWTGCKRWNTRTGTAVGKGEKIYIISHYDKYAPGRGLFSISKS